VGCWETEHRGSRQGGVRSTSSAHPVARAPDTVQICRLLEPSRRPKVCRKKLDDGPVGHGSEGDRSPSKIPSPAARAILAASHLSLDLPMPASPLTPMTLPRLLSHCNRRLETSELLARPTIRVAQRTCLSRGEPRAAHGAGAAQPCLSQACVPGRRAHSRQELPSSRVTRTSPHLQHSGSGPCVDHVAMTSKLRRRAVPIRTLTTVPRACPLSIGNGKGLTQQIQSGPGTSIESSSWAAGIPNRQTHLVPLAERSVLRRNPPYRSRVSMSCRQKLCSAVLGWTSRKRIATFRYSPRIHRAAEPGRRKVGEHRRLGDITQSAGTQGLPAVPFKLRPGDPRKEYLSGAARVSSRARLERRGRSRCRGGAVDAEVPTGDLADVDRLLDSPDGWSLHSSQNRVNGEGLLDRFGAATARRIRPGPWKREKTASLRRRRCSLAASMAPMTGGRPG